MTWSEPAARPGPWRRRLMLAIWMLGGTVICLRAGQIQVLQGAQWKGYAEDQHTTDKVVAAARGSVLDRDGAAVAVSQEMFRVSIAPHELKDREVAAALLEEALGLSSRAARKLVLDERPWRVVPGRFGPRVREQLTGVSGIYLDRELRRYHPHGDLAGGVLGAVVDGEGRGGVEQTFDDVLRGRSGREVVAWDNQGRPIPGETYVVEEPVSGGEVVLTLDLDLQEIAREALQEAIEKTEARGGDVLVTDPRTGEVLALISIRDGRTTGLGAVHTPYEPGSTLKPFTVAGMLSHDVAKLSDTVDVEDGSWRVAGRTLHDSHNEGRITIADALRVSSNVGIAKAAQGLTPGAQYENLRDFGFGVATGLELPGEVGGTLRRPDRWSRQSPASLAIGYEMSVTPIQMAMAYGALANGGVLMKPFLVREIRDASGRVVKRGEAQVVRRVTSRQIARSVSNVLVGVVQDGTGTEAQVGAFRVAGKSGTSRAYTPNAGYQNGDYFSSFVGFFPAADPQLVVFVKLENPKEGSYYGGAVAAPVTRATMEAALAARASVLDRGELLRASDSRLSRPAPTPVRFASQPIDPPAPPTYESLGGPGGVPLPEVSGLAPRVAARRLHALGLRVILEGQGEIVGTAPLAGARVVPGDTIRLRVHGNPDGHPDG